jgi:Flp pilus assembly pilin Flp
VHQSKERRCDRGESGATATEYALMVGLITLVIMAAVATFGLAVQDLFIVPGFSS